MRSRWIPRKCFFTTTPTPPPPPRPASHPPTCLPATHLWKSLFHLHQNQVRFFNFYNKIDNFIKDMPSIWSKADGSPLTIKNNYILGTYDDFYIKLMALLIQAKSGMFNKYPTGTVLYKLYSYRFNLSLSSWMIRKPNFWTVSLLITFVPYGNAFREWKF